MKLEKPANFRLNTDYLQKIWAGEFSEFITESDERYFYWDEIKYRKNAPFKNPIDNWNLIKTYRTSRYEKIQFGKYTFRYFNSEYTLKSLHDFDQKLMGALEQTQRLSNEKDSFLKHSLIEEAVASSQVEGAATTTQVARQMLKTGRSPRNESEQMIFNNLKAIEYISEFATEPISFKIIIELHQIMTAQTQAEEYSGAFRKGEVFITDHIDGEIAHIPPKWTEVGELMRELCEFINDEEKFIHPIVKASIIHFMIGYIHPFKDGNGRTARALFYWFLLKKGYKSVKDISISRAILDSRTQYDKAFLKTEYDENDLNYFIHYSIKNISLAFEKLLQYRNRKLNERKKANLISYKLLSKGLNRRQADLIGYLYLRKDKQISLNSYAEKHEIVRQTASKDLNELIKLGLIIQDKSTKPYKYSLKNRNEISAFIQ